MRSERILPAAIALREAFVGVFVSHLLYDRGLLTPRVPILFQHV
jgi:hypothetical protein